MKVVQFLSVSTLFMGLHASSFLHAHEDLINILDVEPSIIVDLQYAQADNITGDVLYDSPVAYVRKEVALALQKVQQELLRMGLCLKIWDAYHCGEVEKHLQNIIGDADRAPQTGRHTRGTAVDCTLVWSDSGIELPMPTAFDAISAHACRSYENVATDLWANSVVLETVMAQYGFIPSPDQWWHFDYQGWENYEQINC